MQSFVLLKDINNLSGYWVTRKTVYNYQALNKDQIINCLNVI